MINVLLISLIIVIYTFQSFLCKKYSDNYPGDSGDSSTVFTIVSGLITCILAIVISGFDFNPSLSTVLLGLLCAASLIGYNFFIIKASQTGPYSVLMVFMLAGGIIVPAIVAVVGFGDAISPFKILGIIVVIVSVYLMNRKEDEEGSQSKMFIFTCLALGICNGAYGAFFDISQRITASNGLENEKEEMVAITYATAAIVSLIILAFKKKKATFAAFKQNKRSLFYILTCSLAVSVAINLLVYILQYVDVTILYTFDNAGVLLLSVIMSSVFFKEKLSRINIIGCITMCIALVVVASF